MVRIPADTTILSKSKKEGLHGMPPVNINEENYNKSVHKWGNIKKSIFYNVHYWMSHDISILLLILANFTFIYFNFQFPGLIFFKCFLKLYIILVLVFSTYSRKPSFFMRVVIDTAIRSRLYWQSPSPRQVEWNLW